MLSIQLVDGGTVNPVPFDLLTDAEAAAAGLTFINECGVDPGIDHMSAMRVIHDAEVKGGKVLLAGQPVADAIGADGPVKLGVRPEHLDLDRAGIRVRGWPALVDQGDSVALRILDSQTSAASAMRAGLRRLLMGSVARNVVLHAPCSVMVAR